MSASKTANKSVYKELPLDQLSIGRSQMRKRDADRGIEELASSISKVGLLEPIVVFERDGAYEIVTGQRRFLACHSLGLETIPCMILETPPANEAEALTISLTENLMRREPSERDYIDACTRLFGFYESIQAVVEETGLPEYRVRQYVKAPQLTEPLKRMVEDGKLQLASALAANEVANLPDGTHEELAERVAEVIIDQQMAPQKAKAFAKRIKNTAIAHGVDHLTEDDLSADRFQQTSQQTISLKVSSKVGAGLASYASDIGTSRSDAGTTLLTDALLSKGYISEDSE